MKRSKSLLTTAISLVTMIIVVGSLSFCGKQTPPNPEFTGPVVRGTVFDDRNGNGIMDRGEPGLAGVR